MHLHLTQKWPLCVYLFNSVHDVLPEPIRQVKEIQVIPAGQEVIKVATSVQNLIRNKRPSRLHLETSTADKHFQQVLGCE